MSDPDNVSNTQRVNQDMTDTAKAILFSQFYWNILPVIKHATEDSGNQSNDS